jgi:hypothetical protein
MNTTITIQTRTVAAPRSGRLRPQAAGGGARGPRVYRRRHAGLTALTSDTLFSGRKVSLCRYEQEAARSAARYA